LPSRAALPAVLLKVASTLPRASVRKMLVFKGVGEPLSSPMRRPPRL
jgi:hypothetical protein